MRNNWNEAPLKKKAIECPQKTGLNGPKKLRPVGSHRNNYSSGPPCRGWQFYGSINKKKGGILKMASGPYDRKGRADSIFRKGGTTTDATL